MHYACRFSTLVAWWFFSLWVFVVVCHCMLLQLVHVLVCDAEFVVLSAQCPGAGVASCSALVILLLNLVGKSHGYLPQCCIPYPQGGTTKYAKPPGYNMWFAISPCSLVRLNSVVSVLCLDYIGGSRPGWIIVPLPMIFPCYINMDNVCGHANWILISSWLRKLGQIKRVTF